MLRLLVAITLLCLVMHSQSAPVHTHTAVNSGVAAHLSPSVKQSKEELEERFEQVIKDLMEKQKSFHDPQEPYKKD